MPLRVLLIDNSDTIKRAIEMSLQDYGVSVKTMSTGVDVTNVIESFKPDIVFSDIMLREKSGYEVAEELKNFQSDLPVVLLWSEFMNFNEKKGKDSGAVTHLRKPFDKEQLQKIIKEYVQSSDSKPAQQPSTTEDSKSTQQDEEMGEEEDSFRDFFELPDDGAPTQVTTLSEVDPNKSEQNEKSSSDSTDVMWSIDKAPETEMNESELPEPEEEKEDFIQADINEIPPLENLSIEKSPPPTQSADEKKEEHEEKSFTNLGEVSPLEDAPQPPPISHDTSQEKKDNFTNLGEIPPLEDAPQPPPISHDTSQEKKDNFTNLGEIPPLEDAPQPPPISHHASEEEENKDYKVDVPEENVDFDEMTVGFSEPIDSKKSPSLDDTEVLPTRKNKPDTKEQLASPPDESTKGSPTSKSLSEEELKKIIGEQSREVIEKIVWQLVPDMASNIIREELNRLLNESDK